MKKASIILILAMVAMTACSAENAGGDKSPGTDNASRTKQEALADADGKEEPEFTESPIQLTLDEHTVLIGDSLFHCVDESGVLPEVHYIAKVGVNLDTIQADGVYATDAGKVSGTQAVNNYNPDVVFCMCGVNGIMWMDIEDMLQKYKTFLESIAEPGRTLAVVSVAPVTKRYNDSEKGGGRIQKLIDLYNDRLSDFMKNGNVCYIDITDSMKDEQGFLREEYATEDGLHWNNKGCQAFANALEKSVKEYETPQ